MDAIAVPARRARVAPGRVLGLLAFLAEWPEPDPCRLAAALGFDLDPVLRILDVLFEAGVIDGRNRLAAPADAIGQSDRVSGCEVGRAAAVDDGARRAGATPRHWAAKSVVIGVLAMRPARCSITRRRVGVEANQLTFW